MFYHKGVIDNTSEIKPRNANWENGPWRKIQPGENDDPKYVGVDKNGEKIVPVRIYGNAEQPSQPETTPIQSPTTIAPTAENLRLSKGATRLVSEANRVGINPAPYLAETHTKPGAKVPVKGPLAKLKESVQAKIANARR